mmetsp:Transcript_10657/g.16206  ORF Transcript_10657/g.16206 Transcript_10657/m.16206 type:complete len:254 (+) Transcript_10657:243-1004(+)
MVRIGSRKMKPSVVRKKLQKMPPTDIIEVYVSKISLAEGRFEVSLSKEDALERASLAEKIVPASSLKVGEILTGIVKQVKPYGVFVNVNNANRNGLIHISKVAKRYDSYVAKEDGLKSLGLRSGSPVDVIVLSNDKKRLELDLAPIVEESPADDVEDEVESHTVDSTGAISDALEDEDAAWAAYGAGEGSGSDNASEDEAAMWAAYAAPDSSTNDDEAAMWAAYAAPDSPIDDDEDDYDEDEDIEDALGIGSY